MFISTSNWNGQFLSVPSSLKYYTLKCRLPKFKKVLLDDLTQRVLQTTHLGQRATITLRYRKEVSEATAFFPPWATSLILWCLLLVRPWRNQMKNTILALEEFVICLDRQIHKQLSNKSLLWRLHRLRSQIGKEAYCGCWEDYSPKIRKYGFI